MNKKTAMLLPSGLYDLLPPEAAKESDTVHRLLAGFASFGYQQVAPPLLEFETTLLSGRGEALAPQTFRVSDPLSPGMMGLRADITLQVARIAATRLEQDPRPLRLSYAGPILQRKPDPLKSERQLMQAGIELIGSDAVEAEAEVIVIACELLTGLGITGLSVDVNLPGLLAQLCPEALHDDQLRSQLREAVLRKDTSVIADLPIANSRRIITLMEAAGPVESTLALMDAMGMDAALPLRRLAALVQRSCPDVALTLDPLEYRGFDYHHGIGFSLFTGGLRHELGRGGRYLVAEESAVGFTLSVTHLLPLLAPPVDKKRVLLAAGADAQAARTLRNEGFATIHALSGNPHDEGKRLGCTSILNEESRIEL